MVILQYKHLINIRYCSIEHFCCKVTDFTFSSDGCRRNLLNSWSHCWVGGSLQCWSHLTLRPINSKRISQVFSNWLFSRFLPILGNGYESMIETLCSQTLSDSKFEIQWKLYNSESVSLLWLQPFLLDDNNFSTIDCRKTWIRWICQI